jgi:hypothetical protein
MERGVVVGGLLISGSFLLAVLLNHSAKGPVESQRGVPLQRVEDLAQAPVSRPPSLADCCRRNDKECPPKSEGSSPEEPCKTGQSPSLETDSR